MPSLNDGAKVAGMASASTRQAVEQRLRELSAKAGEALQSRGDRLAAAESCTGGWIAKVVTDIPGSSAWFDRGFVTYSNEAKQDMLGVRQATLQAHGAVSEAVVREMAEGALANSRATVTVSVSGVAGPGGGTEAKPVGRVWMAWAREGGETQARCFDFEGDRDAVRCQAVMAGLEGVREMLR